MSAADLATARVFVPENTLARGIDAPGAADVHDMLRDAARRVEAMAPAVNLYVADRSVALLRAMAGPAPTTPEARLSLFTEASLLAEVAGAGRPDAIGDIAKGIAVLIQHLNADDGWRGDLIHVHAAALGLVMNRSQKPNVGVLLSGLRSARASIGVLE